MKPRLVVVQCWALGDLAITLPFLLHAKDRYEVMLVAKPYASELVSSLAPGIKHMPFEAPWTRFQGKYAFHRWPWRSCFRLIQEVRKWKPDVAASARWDPRDHFLMAWFGARERVGFARMGSGLLLTKKASLGKKLRHRHEDWRAIARTLEIALPSVSELELNRQPKDLPVIIHTGAARKVRVWPLDRYHKLVGQIRSRGFKVRILCDPDQLEFWKARGNEATAPTSIQSLMDGLRSGSCFIGNDSGPGHLAAIMGLPTLTLFGPQLPVWFSPPHPDAQWIPGKPCPHKPCFDYCRFEEAHCLTHITLDEALDKTMQCLSDWKIIP